MMAASAPSAPNGGRPIRLRDAHVGKQKLGPGPGSAVLAMPGPAASPTASIVAASHRSTAPRAAEHTSTGEQLLERGVLAQRIEVSIAGKERAGPL